jgi:hypothetical protein
MIYELNTVEYIKTIQTEIGPMASYTVKTLETFHTKNKAVRAALFMKRYKGIKEGQHLEVVKVTGNGVFTVIKVER